MKGRRCSGGGDDLAVFRALGLPLPLGSALLLLTLLCAGTAPPSSPGRLGVFHALVVELGIFGLDRAVALAYGAVLHALVYGPQILLGALAHRDGAGRGEETRRGGEGGGGPG